MKLRSLLFVPGGDQRKLEKARGCGADALILDLEDSVAPSAKSEARAHVASVVADAAPRDFSLIVRINSLDSGLALQDLAAVVKPGLDAIMIPKAQGGGDLVRFGHYLDAFEARAGMATGAIKMIVVATESGKAMFGLQTYAPAHPRLIALTWGAEDLSADIGATRNRDEGAWTFPYQIARAHCLFASAAANTTAIETIFVDFRDLEALEEDCHRARRDGFMGRMAIHPDQVETINRCFTPAVTEIAWAQRVIEAFATRPGTGAFALDGKMVDIPHLKAARKLVASL